MNIVAPSSVAQYICIGSSVFPAFIDEWKCSKSLLCSASKRITGLLSTRFASYPSKRSELPISILSVLLCAGVTACSDVQAPERIAPELTIEERLARPPDFMRGERLFRACAVCHERSAGARHRIGPNLFGIFGARAGQASGFRYSRALKARDITWDSVTLDAYIETPRNVIPGGSMSYPGEGNAAHRRDIIAYLETLK